MKRPAGPGRPPVPPATAEPAPGPKPRAAGRLRLNPSDSAAVQATPVTPARSVGDASTEPITLPAFTRGGAEHASADRPGAEYASADRPGAEHASADRPGAEKAAYGEQPTLPVAGASSMSAPPERASVPAAATVPESGRTSPRWATRFGRRPASGTGPGAPDDDRSVAGTSGGQPDDAEADRPVKPLSPAAARREFRRARRARKRYERDEVRRFTRRSRRRRRGWLVLAGAFAALIAFVLVGAYSPILALRTIEVVGTERIPAEQVQEALSGQIGTPLPIVDMDAIKRELSEFTLIQNYAIESRPPDTLVVRIVERVPVAVLQTETGFDLVDAAGVVLQSGAERPAGYPLISAAPGTPGFTAATAVIRALPEEIRVQLDSVQAATTDDVTLTLNGGTRVVWGSAEQAEYKAAVLAALMANYPPGSVGEYDVTSPASAVIR